MKKMIIISCAALALSVAFASAPSFAQGPGGLNGGNAGGPGYSNWAGPENNWNNPVSGSAQDPAMQHRPLRLPGR